MKFKFLKLLTVTVVLFNGAAFSQMSSAYSRIGVGDLNYTYSAANLALGGGGVAVSEKDFIGIINPAGWDRLKLTRTEFAFGVNSVFVENGSEKGYFAKGIFSGFTMAFPASTEYGVGIVAGIVPYSTVSYKAKLKNNVSEINGRYSLNMSGNGGLSKVFLGSSFHPLKDFSIGATVEYYFGEINHASEVIFDDNSVLSSYHEDQLKPRGIGTTLGFISPDISSLFGSSKIKDFRIGASVNLIANLNTDTMLIAHSTNAYDTLNSGTVDMKIPTRITAGISLVVSDKYQIFADYTTQSWKDYSLNENKASYLRALNKVTAGFTYKPIKSIGASNFERIIWRASAGYEQSQYIINGTGINEFFIAGGFSYPLSAENTVDIGIQYCNRGTKDSNLIKENFIRLNAGFSLGELWFFRQEK